MNTEPDTAAHGDAVHEGHIRLRVGCNQMVELVLEAKVGDRLFDALLARPVEGREGVDVAACAEGAPAVALEDDDVCELGLFPFLWWGRGVGWVRDVVQLPRPWETAVERGEEGRGEKTYL